MLEIVNTLGPALVELGLIKAHIVIHDTDDDQLIDAYLKAAIEHVETFTCRTTVQKQLRYTAEPCKKIQLPLGPVGTLI